MSKTALADHLAAARLDGLGYVVLGAGGGGLGDAACAALAGAGADVMCVDCLPDRAEEIATTVGGVAHVADVTSRAEMTALFERVKRHFGDRFAGVIDIVGVGKRARIDELDDAAINQQFDITLRHALLTVQLAGPLLAQRGGGSLTFVGSIAGLGALANQTIYGVAKAALHQLVRYAAQELGPDRVRVNAVAPGFITTPRRLPKMPAQTWDQLAAENPLRRVGAPDDIAKALLFLASNLADYVTGSILVVDGGLTQMLALPDVLMS